MMPRVGETTACADCGADAVMYVAEREDGPERPLCDAHIDALGRWWPRRVVGEQHRPLRCLDCWGLDARHGQNVERRETWEVYPQDIRRTRIKPAVCDECWAEREQHAPAKPPFGEPRDDHEPTHAGEPCLDCGESVLAVDTLGTPREGAVVYQCPACGAEMDDWAMEDYRFDPGQDGAHDGGQCVCCGQHALESGPTVKRGENGPIAIYRCRACDGVVGDDDLATWKWSYAEGRGVNADEYVRVEAQ